VLAAGPLVVGDAAWARIVSAAAWTGGPIRVERIERAGAGQAFELRRFSSLGSIRSAKIRRGS
jgi:hypothetical protein